jgi:hypothetical protein
MIETFIALYLVIGILVASFTCGFIKLKSTWERIALALFDLVIVASWPLVVAYLAPSTSRNP